ncbi:hypothetical protein O977_06475 [Mycobacterium avium subsp. paratuberculosis 10-5975]|nr:hypothetical protein O977_06475 [Mycobacterium avium subsp. paratuberculosis 10-5975]
MADQQEHHALEQEVDQPPDGAGLQAARPGFHPRRVVADDQPAHHDGQHAGGGQLFGDQIGEKRRGQRDGVGGQHVVPPPAQQAPGVGEHLAHHQAADGRQHELPDRRRRRERGPARHGDGDRERGQRGRVVEQSLALDQRDDVERQALLAGDGERGHRIGRRHRRAQHHAHRERRAAHEQAERDTDRRSGQQHEDDRQADHRA